VDTADVYGAGKNEKLLQKVLKTRRKEVFLSTKFGFQFDEEGWVLGMCGTAEYVKQACENSMKRLGVDCIDLYYLHRIDPQTDVEKTVLSLSVCFLCIFFVGSGLYQLVA